MGRSKGEKQRTGEWPEEGGEGRGRQYVQRRLEQVYSTTQHGGPTTLGHMQ